MFPGKESLCKHVLVHTGEQSFHYYVRDIPFPLEGILNMSSHHTGVEPYHCDVCDKGFAEKRNLKNMDALLYLIVLCMQ